MKLKLLLPVLTMVILIAESAYSVTDAEFYKMQEQLKTALMKINALEQIQKQSSDNKKGLVQSKSKKELSNINILIFLPEGWSEYPNAPLIL